MKLQEDELKLAQDKFSYEKSSSGTDDDTVGGDPDDNTPDNPQDVDSPNTVPEFTGVSYAQAVAHIKKYGGNSNGLIPVKEFKQAQMSGSSFGGKPLKNMTYAEYLKNYCAWATS